MDKYESNSLQKQHELLQTGTKECLAQKQSNSRNSGTSITLTIDEPLPSMKRMTESIKEHWKALLHAVINEVA